MLGVVSMRFAAVLFIKLLNRFPSFENAAYLLVSMIGLKLLLIGLSTLLQRLHRLDFHRPRERGFLELLGADGGLLLHRFLAP